MLGETNLTAIFREINDHMVKTDVNNNHIFGLIKLIAKVTARSDFTILVKNTFNNSLGKGLGRG